jgi:chitin synthase
VDDDDTPRQTEGGVPTVAGKFRNALDTLFQTLEEAQAWFVFFINPNDAQLANQLKGRSIKGQVRGVTLSEVAKRAAVAFEVGMTPEEFRDCSRDPMGIVDVTEGEPQGLVDHTRTAFGLGPKGVVQGREKVGYIYIYVASNFVDRLSRSSSPKLPSIAWGITCVPGEVPRSPYDGGFGDTFNQ